MKPGNVPTARVAPIIAELIRERWPHGGGIEVLAEKVGCDFSTIENVIAQTHEGVEFDLADKLLCALGRPDIWRGRLADVYLGVKLDWGVCFNPHCRRLFMERLPGHGGSRRVYCSNRCKVNHHRWQSGAVRGGIKQFERCRKGHTLTADNRNKDGRCKQCRREYFAEKRAKAAA